MYLIGFCEKDVRIYKLPGTRKNSLIKFSNSNRNNHSSSNHLLSIVKSILHAEMQSSTIPN